MGCSLDSPAKAPPFDPVTRRIDSTLAGESLRHKGADYATRRLELPTFVWSVVPPGLDSPPPADQTPEAVRCSASAASRRTTGSQAAAPLPPVKLAPDIASMPLRPPAILVRAARRQMCSAAGASDRPWRGRHGKIMSSRTRPGRLQIRASDPSLTAYAGWPWLVSWERERAKARARGNRAIGLLGECLGAERRARIATRRLKRDCGLTVSRAGSSPSAGCRCR